MENLNKAFVSDIKILSAETKEKALAKLPNGYVFAYRNPWAVETTDKLECNHSVGGNYIYIAYKKSNDIAKPITDIVILDGKDTVKDKYTKLPDDLNKDARGHFLYLAYTKENMNDLAIEEIGGYYNKETIPPVWQKIDFDLNKGAGGDFIHLVIKKGANSDN